MRLFLLLTLCLSLMNSALLFAQATKKITIVTLKNGLVLKGRILTFEEGGELEFQTLERQTYSCPASDVVSITNEEMLRTKSARRAKKLKRASNGDHIPSDKHWYADFKLETAFPLNVSNSHLFGFHFHVGYQVLPFLRVSAGAAIAVHTISAFFPVYAKVRWVPLQTSNTPYLECAVGVQLNSQEIAPTRPYLRPAIGYRFPSKRRTHVTLDIGILISEEVRWIQRDPFGRFGDFLPAPFQQPTISVGIVF